MLLHRLEGKLRRAGMSHSADDAAVTAGRDVTAGPRIGFLHVARGENLLVENRNGTDAVPTAFVSPDL